MAQQSPAVPEHLYNTGATTGADAAQETIAPACSPRAVIEQLLNTAFHPSLNRHPRSAEYVAGARAALLQRFVGKPFASPHREGTAAADAFFAGADEGRRIHADYVAESHGKHLAPESGLAKALAIFVAVLILLGAALDIAALRG